MKTAVRTLDILVTHTVSNLHGQALSRLASSAVGGED